MSEAILQESLSNRVVCLGLAELELGGETPAHAPAVRRACHDRSAVLADAVVGKLDEATVARSLNELEASGLADSVQSESTAVGKGRPAFELVDDPERTLDVLADDDPVAPAVDAIRTDR